MNKRDRDAVDFARMQMDMYGCVGVLLMVSFALYGLAHLIWSHQEIMLFLQMGLSVR